MNAKHAPLVAAVALLATVTPSAAHADSGGSIAASAQPQVPLGNFATGASFGFGAQVGVDIAVAPKVVLTGGAGVTKYVIRSDVFRLFKVPVSVGARYAFQTPTVGPYVAAQVDANIFNLIIDYQDSFVTLGFPLPTGPTVRLGGGVGGGYRFKALDVGARVETVDVTHFVDALQVGLSVGCHFVTF